MAIFQFQYGYGGDFFSQFLYWLQYWGIRDIILPFILFFSLFYAILSSIKLFGEGAPAKRFNVIFSLVVALLVVIPHVTGTYPPGADVVQLVNQTIPEIALLVIAVVLAMMMLGLGYGKKVSFNWLMLAAMIILGLIFLSALTPLPILRNLSYYFDPSVQVLVVMILVFGLLVWWMTAEKPAEGKMGKLMEWLRQGPGETGPER